MVSQLLFGLAIGVVMALTGAGGGILAVPLLVFGVGFSVAQAAPVGLLAVGLAATMGAALGLRQGIVRYRAALWMAVTGVLAAPPGVWLAQHVANQWLSILFALTLLFIAWRTYRQAGNEAVQRDGAGTAGPPCMVSDATGRLVWTTHCARVLGGVGGIAGLLSGLLGVGGGFVIVPALKRYTDLMMQSVVATSLAVIALVSLSGVASSAVAGRLDLTHALPFALGAVAGMLGGGLVAKRLAGPLLQKGFAVLAALVAAGMLVRAFL